MQKLPHLYTVSAQGSSTQNIALTSPGLPAIESAAPAEFGGPGDLWSPETLLVAAIADCYCLSFKAIARASKLDWLALKCDVEGVLDRMEKVTQFTEFRLSVALSVPAGVDDVKANRLLQKAESLCLITNSMKSTTHLTAQVTVAN